MVDVGNTINRATVVQLNARGSVLRNTIGAGDPNDFYRVNLRSRSVFNLHLKGTNPNANVELISDRNRNGRADLGEVVASSRAPGRQADTMKIEGLAAGTYFVRVFPAGGSTNYSLTMSATATQAASFAYQVVERTNQFRQQNGLPALALNTQLSQVAQSYTKNMAENDFFSHTAPNGTTFDQRITAIGYRFRAAGENLAVGQRNPASVMQGWMNSSGHRANMLSAQFQEIGVGYFFLRNDTGNTNWNHYWSQQFGTPA